MKLSALCHLFSLVLLLLLVLMKLLFLSKTAQSRKPASRTTTSLPAPPLLSSLLSVPLSSLRAFSESILD